jgi:hopanoid biosynthesis associated protein HpnK
MKRLIINADDFGFTRGVNEGIVRAFKLGVVTSTTLMANGEAFDHAVELAKANPGLAVGCHLAVVGGKPVLTEGGTLVNGDSRLPPTLSSLMGGLMRGKIRIADIESEFRAQVDRVFKAGIVPTHLDSHKHSHTHPRVMRALTRVAADFGIKCVRNPFEGVFARAKMGDAARARRAAYFKQFALSAAIFPNAIQFHRIVREYGLRTPNHFRGVRLTGLLDSEALRGVIISLSEGTTELMCHPGLVDDDLEAAQTRLKSQRQRELEALVDPRVREILEESGIELVSYREL